MPKGVVDISILGDKALMRTFARLDDKLEKKIAREALRKSANRNRAAIARAAPVDRGLLQAGMATTAVRSERSRTHIRIIVKMPERSVLGIPEKAKGYYPFAIEYGFVTRGGGFKAADSYIRKTVDANADAEHARMRKDIQSGIIREAKKK